MTDDGIALPKNPLEFVVSKEDIQFEQRLIKDPESVELWLLYFKHKQETYPKDINHSLWVLSRAVHKLSRSYKLWMIYLNQRLQLLESHFSKIDAISLKRLFEQSLLTLSKFVEIWRLYLSFLMVYTGTVFDIGAVRTVFNTAFKTLPLTQHDKIWPLLLSFASTVKGKTGFLIYTRFYEYKTLLPDKVINESEVDEVSRDEDINVILEGLKDTISSIDELQKLSYVYEEVLSNGQLLSKSSASELEMYNNYTDIMSSQCIKQRHSNSRLFYERNLVDIVHQLIQKFPDQLSSFIVKLAKYWIGTNEYHKVRGIFEYGIERSLTVRDFTVIFNSYVEFEDSIMTKLANEVDAQPEDKSLEMELNLSFERFEALLNNRSLLINDVQLRQNINNVDTWLQRIGLFDTSKQLDKISKTYEDAVKSIDPRKTLANDQSAGKGQGHSLVLLWINYATLYEDNNELEMARTLYDTAVKVPFKFPDDLADVWIAWAEMELRHDDLDQALTIIEHPLRIPSKAIADKAGIKILQNGRNTNTKYHDTDLSAQMRTHKSIKLWTFYLDLVEGASEDIEKTTSVYEQIIDLKIATPMTIVNYTSFLEENEYYERSLQVFEKGVHLFSFPIVFEIWNIYLSKMIEFQDKCQIGLERVRDLFDSFFEVCPPKMSKPVYLSYANFEETKGYKLKSLDVYKSAISHCVDDESRIEIYKIYIAKSIEFLGLESTRSVYADAIENLQPYTAGYVSVIVLGFTSLETTLKQFKRVREIFKYGSELLVKVCDTSSYLIQFGKRVIEDRDSIWDAWKRFELENGNEETYKEMLRYKRMITVNSDDTLFDRLKTSAAAVAANTGENIVPGSLAPIGFVASSTGPKISEINLGESKVEESPDTVINEDAIELDIDDLSD